MIQHDIVVTSLREQEEIQNFAKEAAAAFAKNANWRTWTKEEIKPGCLFAVKWGWKDSAVLVFRIDENFQPIVYSDITTDD